MARDRPVMGDLFWERLPRLDVSTHDRPMESLVVYLSSSSSPDHGENVPNWTDRPRPRPAMIRAIPPTHNTASRLAITFLAGMVIGAFTILHAVGAI